MSKKKINTDNLVKWISKLGSQRELNTIRDSFALILPLVIAGAIGIMGVTLFFGGWGAQSSSILGWIAKAAGGIKTSTGGNWEFLGKWKEVSLNGEKIFATLNTATFGWISMYIVFIIGWVYSNKLNCKTPMLASSVSMASFLIAGGTNAYFFSSNGLLGAIAISLVSTYIFCKLQNVKKLRINMPNGVPPAVGRAFSSLIPIVLTTLIFGVLNYTMWAAGNYSGLTILDKHDKVVIKSEDMTLLAMFFKGVSSPFIGFMGSKSAGFWVMLLYLFAYGFFWWCGLHGGSVLSGIFYPIWFGLITQNSDAVQSYGSYQAAYDAGALSIANWAFLEQFTMITGWGSTGMLLLGAIMFSKNPVWRQVNKIAVPAGIFNVNEPVTYGYPIMFNPILAIPCLIAMPLSGTIGYLATSWGWMNVAYIYVPWALPFPLGSFLTTGMDWRAIIVIFAIFATMFFLYLPFIFIDNKVSKNNGTEMSESLIERIKSKRRAKVKSE